MIEDVLPARYELSGTKFCGGQGDVYICYDEHLDRDVAVKYCPKTKLKYGLIEEINVLNSLASKHVVEIYDVLSEGDTCTGLIEEYVSGHDLQDYHITNPTLDNYLKTLYQIACGIRDIHNCNIIHRDIKPQNIKFDSEGLIKILDFGLSNFDNSNITTKAHGTNGFRAPEMYQLPFTVQKSIDTYAFGVTAWALLGSLPKELLQIPPQSDSQVKSIGSLPAIGGGSVINIIDNCLDVNPNKRPSMSKVADVLAQRLLQNKHRGVLITHGGSNNYEVNCAQSRIKIGGGNSLEIYYDGQQFKAQNIKGNVYINNKTVCEENLLPGSCVLTLGHHDLKGSRTFFAFEISHPEVLL